MGRLKRWPMPKNAHFSHYCCHCKYWTFIKGVGASSIGVCKTPYDEPTEKDAYDKPCGAWKEAK